MYSHQHLRGARACRHDTQQACQSGFVCTRAQDTTVRLRHIAHGRRTCEDVSQQRPQDFPQRRGTLPWWQQVCIEITPQVLRHTIRNAGRGHGHDIIRSKSVGRQADAWERRATLFWNSNARVETGRTRVALPSRVRAPAGRAAS